MGLFKTTDKGTTDPSELLLEKYGIKLKDDVDADASAETKTKNKTKKN